MGYHKIFNLHGVNFNSRKDPSSSRQDLLKGITKRSKLTLEEFTYDGEPAIMVINKYNNLDIGVVPADDVEKIRPHLDKPYNLFFIEKYYFDDDRCGIKLQFYAYTEEELREAEEEKKRIAEEKAARRSKPLYKVWWFYLILIFFAILLYMAIAGELTERMMQV